METEPFISVATFSVGMPRRWVFVKKKWSTGILEKNGLYIPDMRCLFSPKLSGIGLNADGFD